MYYLLYIMFLFFLFDIFVFLFLYIFGNNKKKNIKKIINLIK